MAVRETTTTTQPQHRQNVRNFALLWTGVTLLVGAITFAAIYTATGYTLNTAHAASNDDSSVNSSSNSSNVGNGVGIIAGAASNNDNGNNGNSNNNSGNQSNPLVVAQQATSASGGAPATNTPKALAQAGAATAAPTANASGGGSPTATIAATADADFDMGIAVDDNADPKVYSIWTKQVSSDLKLNWAKLQIAWRDIEGDKGNIYWGNLDTEVPMLYKANTKVLLSITGGPKWAIDPGAKYDPGKYDGPPHDPQVFADFVTTVLKRYPGMINAVEVWNEINLDREWSTAPQSLDPARYVKLLQVTHDAIKAVDPNILVISAALSPTGASAGQSYQDDFVYFQKLIAAGMLKYADCVGAHHNGYNVPPDQDSTNLVNRPRARFRGPFDNINHSWYFKATLEGYHKYLVAAGSNTKLCVTEFGWPSLEGLKGQPRQGFEFAGDNSLADQANYIDGAIKEMMGWGWVRLAFLWNLNYGYQANFDMTGPTSDNIPYSILGPNFVPRPAWQKIQAYDFRDKARKATTNP